MLYNKYNPKSIQEVKGCERFKLLLNRPIEEIQPLILLGPHGVGKSCCANILMNRYFGDFDFTYERHPDTQFFNRRDYHVRSNFVTDKVDGFCSIRSTLVKRRKLIIFDDADKICEKHLDELLGIIDKYSKTMSGLTRLFVFTANNQLSNENIVSRCMTIWFKKLPPFLIAERLSEVVTAENLEISKGQLNYISKNCNGDMRQALNLLDNYTLSLTNRFQPFS